MFIFLDSSKGRALTVPSPLPYQAATLHPHSFCSSHWQLFLHRSTRISCFKSKVCPSPLMQCSAMCATFAVLHLHCVPRTQKQTMNSQLLASKHTVSLALLVSHNCGSHYTRSQRRNYKEKSWCLSSIPFCSAFSLVFHTWREIIEWVSIAPSYPTKMLWLRGRIGLDSVQTDLGSDIFVFPSIGMFSHQQTGYLFRFTFSCDIISFQIMLTIIFNDAVPTCAAHSSMLSTDILMLRKAKGREFITEAPFRLLARCSEMPVVPTHFLWTRINWSIQPSRVYSILFPFGTYSVFCTSVMKTVQLIMLISFIPSIL